jgi:peptidoglycan/xylan/chitin deacetylase (PgdA/CDA1 family)
VFRRSAVLVALCLTLAGCGIQLRTPAGPPAPTAPTVSVTPVDLVAPRPNPVLPAPTPDPLVLEPGQTVVTITFDDGRASNATAARMMTDHGLAGTFYINSGNVGKPGYVTLPELDTIALNGHEIAGHTVTHPHIGQFTHDEIVRQVCDDRNTLLGWGYPVRNFAYPFGAAPPEFREVIQTCGYNSARGLDGLRTVESTGLVCPECGSAESVPPVDPFYTRAPSQVRSNWTTETLQSQVTDGQSSGGGWVQFTFHGICPTDCSDITMAQDEFDRFLTWLAGEQAAGRVIVRTVGDVIGGPVQSPVASPPATTTVVNPDLEESQDGVPSCWERASYGNNSPEFSLVSSGDGGMAERLVMRDYVDGDAKLMPTLDLGTCAIAVMPGQSYTIAASYTSTVPTSFSVQYRLARGVWVYGGLSPKFDPADEHTRARWTMPPIPEGVTAVSFGLTLAQNGELVTDDYSLIPQTKGPS